MRGAPRGLGSAMSSPPSPPRSQASEAARVSALLGLLFGLTGLGSASVAIVLPVMADDLGVSTGVSAWAISLYALMLAVATPLYGRVSDLVGIRLPLTIGVVMMSVGAVGGALAPDFGLLLVARILQGAGAAAIPTLGVAILSARYVGAVKGRALGRLAGVAAAITSLGPLAGGGVEAGVGWRAVLALPVLGAFVLPVLWRRVPTTGTGASLDLVGAALVATTAAGVVLLVQSPSTGPVVAGIGAAMALLGAPAVAAWVRRRPDGFLPRDVIRNATVVRSSLAAAAIPAAWFALLIVVPAVLVAEGWEPWQVGLVLLPSAVTGLLAPRLAGPLLARIGAGRTLAAATVGAALSLTVASLGAEVHSSVLLAVAIVALTLAFGVGQPALMQGVGDAVAEDVRGVALGIATLIFMVGAGLGAAVIGGLGELLGLAGAMLLLAALPLAGLVALVPEVRRQERAAEPVADALVDQPVD